MLLCFCIGYGHSTPQTLSGKLFCMIYALIGIPLCLVMFQAVGERLNSFTSWFIQVFKKTLRFKKHEVNQTELVFVGGFLAFLIVFGGAAIFTHYENWSYFNSVYYCVVTLTTIGFGDYVALQVR
jgi:potassium channel subfamily K protein 9